MSEQPKNKPGRKPIGERTMTEAERKRRQRSLKEQAGVQQAFFQLQGDVVTQLDKIVQAYGLRSRAEALKGLMEFQLKRMLDFLEDVDSEISSLPGGESKEAMELKREYWRLLTDPNIARLTTEQREELFNTIKKAREAHE